MNKLTKTVIAVATVAIAGWVTTLDHDNDTVALMPQDKYETIVSNLHAEGNDDPSNRDIVEWMKEHEIR